MVHCWNLSLFLNRSSTHTLAESRDTLELLSRETTERELDVKCLFDSFLLKLPHFDYIYLYHTHKKTRVPAKLYIFSVCVICRRFYFCQKAMFLLSPSPFLKIFLFPIQGSCAEIFFFFHMTHWEISFATCFGGIRSSSKLLSVSVWILYFALKPCSWKSSCWPYSSLLRF